MSTNSVSGVTTPVWRPAVAVTTLNAEPGGYSPWVTRLSRGAAWSLLSRAQSSSRLLGS